MASKRVAKPKYHVGQVVYRIHANHFEEITEVDGNCVYLATGGNLPSKPESVPVSCIRPLTKRERG